LIATLVDRVWQDAGRIVAAKPREPFLHYFQAANEPRGVAKSGVSKADLSGQLSNLSPELRQLFGDIRT